MVVICLFLFFFSERGLLPIARAGTESGLVSTTSTISSSCCVGGTSSVGWGWETSPSASSSAARRHARHVGPLGGDLEETPAEVRVVQGRGVGHGISLRELNIGEAG